MQVVTPITGYYNNNYFAKYIIIIGACPKPLGGKISHRGVPFSLSLAFHLVSHTRSIQSLSRQDHWRSSSRTDRRPPVRPTAARHAPAAAVFRPTQPNPTQPHPCFLFLLASLPPVMRPTSRPPVRPPARPTSPPATPPLLLPPAVSPPPTRFLDSSLPPSLASLAVAHVSQPGLARPVLRPRHLARLAGHPHATALQSVDLTTALMR